MSKTVSVVRWVLIVSATLILTISLIPVAGLWPLVPFLFLWNLADDGRPVRLTDADLSFLLWETE